ncbi:hypothetical protein WG219_13090 [Ectopseudomonas mendocina]|uniref:Uncharacterized protein n=1 Tax=Ectopseudomonas mendocina TaxID=300 RepID=A0ABZ2RBW7_ECTME
MKKMGLLIGAILLSTQLHAELVERTETVKGRKPEITNSLGVFNYTEKGRVPKVGDKIRHYSITARDLDGDAYTMHLQWLRDGEPIPGATGNGIDIIAAEYRPTAEDIGKMLSVRVSISTSPDITDPFQGDTKYSNEIGPVTEN